MQLHFFPLILFSLTAFGKGVGLKRCCGQLWNVESARGSGLEPILASKKREREGERDRRSCHEERKEGAKEPLGEQDSGDTVCASSSGNVSAVPLEGSLCHYIKNSSLTEIDIL